MEGLLREGFHVARAATGQEALAAPVPDVVLLDLRLPDMDGYDVCRKLRARSNVAILMVTARGTELDRVLGLELGADDYIVKPFGFRELVARIRAVWRRSQELAPGDHAAELPEESSTGPGARRPYDRSPLQASARGRRGGRPDAQGVRPVGPFGRGPGSRGAP